MRRARAFTLVEILVVVVLLGILAGIVIPSIGKSTLSARESTLAMSLSLLRRFIPVYTGQHLEVAPGYPNGDRSTDPTEQAFIDQAMLSSNKSGQTAARGTPGFRYGPYLSKIPTNPFNRQSTLEILTDGQNFPIVPDGQHGWVYKAQTGEVRADYAGTDDRGQPYYEY